jgi:hypothetical protein
VVIAYRHAVIAYRHAVIAYRHAVIAYRHAVIAYRHAVIAYRHAVIAYRHVVIAYRHAVIAYRHAVIAYRHVVIAYRHVVIAYRHVVIAYRHVVIAYRHAVIAYSHAVSDDRAKETAFRIAGNVTHAAQSATYTINSTYFPLSFPSSAWGRRLASSACRKLRENGKQSFQDLGSQAELGNQSKRLRRHKQGDSLSDQFGVCITLCENDPHKVSPVSDTQ